MSELATQPERNVDVAFLFSVMTDDGQVGDFMSVEGMSWAIEPYEHVEGGRSRAKRQLLGQGSHGRVTLRQGFMNLSWLYDWIAATRVGSNFRRDLVVLQLLRNGDPVRRYDLRQAWPVEWKAPKLDASTSQVPIEELHLVCASIEMRVVDDE